MFDQQKIKCRAVHMYCVADEFCRFKIMQYGMFFMIFFESLLSIAKALSVGGTRSVRCDDS